MTKSDLLSNELPTKIIGFLKHSLKSEEFEILPLAGDASARRYFRVAYNNQTYVLMEWEPFIDDSDYPFLSVLNHFKAHNVHTPTVVDKSPENGLILLEDLGDLTLERKFWESQNQQHVLPFYKLAIDELIKIHYNCSEDNNKPCTAFHMTFDTEKLLWELNYAKQHLLETLLKINFTDSESSQLLQDFIQICETLSEQKRFICHRDYHSRNLMLKMGKVRVIDFQDARMGPIQYDLVSLLHDSYVNLDEEVHDDLLNYYLDQAQFFYDTPLDLENFNRVYELQIIQRCFKACGSFASFFNTREDLRYIRHIQPTLKKVYRILKKRNEHLNFIETFEKYDLINKDIKKICTPSS